MMRPGHRPNADIPRLVMDEYNLRILSATSFSARTARAVAYELDIPMATCYRRIKALLAADLLEEQETVLSRLGRRCKLYRSRVEAIDIRFEKGRLHVGLRLWWDEPLQWVVVPGAPPSSVAAATVRPAPVPTH